MLRSNLTEIHFRFIVDPPIPEVNGGLPIDFSRKKDSETDRGYDPRGESTDRFTPRRKIDGTTFPLLRGESATHRNGEPYVKTRPGADVGM